MPRSNRATGKREPTGIDRLSDMSSSGGVEDVSDSPHDGRSNKKLDYPRVSMACSRCRRRKMRCEPAGDEAGGPCRKCIKDKQECLYEPVDHASPVPSAGISRSHTDHSESRSIIAPLSNTLDRAQLLSTGAHRFPESKVFESTNERPVGPAPGLGYNASQIMDANRSMLPHRDFTQGPPMGRDFAAQAQGYGAQFHSGYPIPGHHVQQSSYSQAPPLPQSDYITSSSAETWGHAQIPILPSTEYHTSHLYQPPAEYNPFGVPRRATTMPYSAPVGLPLAHTAPIQSSHNYYGNSPMNNQPMASNPDHSAVDPRMPHAVRPSEPHFRGRGRGHDPYQQYQ